MRPRTEDEIRRVVSACARDRVPITLRGSGTGNYGQSVPLAGGVVMDLSGFNAFCWLRRGSARALAGIRLAEIDRHTRPEGWELRWLPSTFRSATLGGLFGGGFGGVGSINHGPVAAPGNVLGARVMSVEEAPQVVELRGAEAMHLHHVYGANGIVLELEVALAPVQPWLECIATFPGFDAGLEFASALAHAPGIAKKEVCFFSADVCALMSGLADSLPAGRSAAIVLVAESSESAFAELVARFGGALGQRKTADEAAATNRTLLEHTWNHTTLMALKVDKSLTYLQTAFVPERHLEQAKALERALGGEVLMHLEFLRGRDGRITCSGLPLVRFSDEARLERIMQIHREHGVTINNPHVYVVEDGKQQQLDPAALAAKRRFDPFGLLNPGKLRGWPVGAAG